jgi:carboxypeptidase Q
MTNARLPVLLVLLCSARLLGAGGEERTTSSLTEEGKRSYRTAMEQADEKIYQEVKEHSELMSNLEYLTSNIGPRLTGSKEMQAASEWTLERFREYGVDAHLETTQIPHAWQRGDDTAKILTPISQAIAIHAMGWSKATPGPVTGPVVVLQVESASEIEKYRGHLKGAIVLTRTPAEVPSDVPDNAFDAVLPPPRGIPHPQSLPPGARRKLLASLLMEEQVAAVLLDSAKTDSLFTMGTMATYQPTDMPVAFVTHESYSLLYRLARKGPVTMRLNIAGSFSFGPVPASITVAEMRGSEYPEQRVIIGAHLDSWDLGQGALDNGTGAMAVLEAARTLRSLGWKPKRTITFVLFTGEEEDGLGAKMFLSNHAKERNEIDAVLIHDTGTGKVLSIALENLYETAPIMTEIYEPLREVFDLQPLSTRYLGASDHEFFLRSGIPAYFCIQAFAHYREAHHSQTDTFDKVIPAEINQGAALLAAWAWNVSEMPEALPHHVSSQN